MNIIRSSYYIHGPWGDEIYFCCLICVTQLWALHVAEILALPLFEYKRPQYWNSTSGFNCDLFTVIGIWLCIGLPDFMQIGWSPTDLWHHIDFTRWQPERRKKSTSGFWFGHVSHLRSSKDIGILNFDQIISLHGRDITTFSSSKQTATILKCYFRFQLDLFSVIGMRFCISLPNFVQKDDQGRTHDVISIFQDGGQSVANHPRQSYDYDVVSIFQDGGHSVVNLLPVSGLATSHI